MPRPYSFPEQWWSLSFELGLAFDLAQLTNLMELLEMYLHNVSILKDKHCADFLWTEHEAF